MKTGMEAPLIGLVVLTALGFLWVIWSGMQVDLAVAATTASASGVAAPVMLGGEWVVKALAGTVVGGCVTAFIAWLVVWVKKQIRNQNQKPKWESGPNANWGQQARGPKMPSEAELYRLMLMRQMAGNAQPPGVRQAGGWLEAEDEPTINF